MNHSFKEKDLTKANTVKQKKKRTMKGMKISKTW